MDKLALETVESGKGRCLSKLRGVPYPRATDAHSKSGLQGLWEDMRPAYSIRFSREAASRARMGCLLELGWQWTWWRLCILCGDWGRGIHKTPNSGDIRGQD